MHPIHKLGALLSSEGTYARRTRRSISFRRGARGRAYPLMARGPENSRGTVLAIGSGSEELGQLLLDTRAHRVDEHLGPLLLERVSREPAELHEPGNAEAVTPVVELLPLGDGPSADDAEHARTVLIPRVEAVQQGDALIEPTSCCLTATLRRDAVEKRLNIHRDQPVEAVLRELTGTVRDVRSQFLHAPHAFNREPALPLEHHEPQVRLVTKDLHAPNGEHGGYEQLELRVTADRIQIAPRQKRAGYHDLNFLERRWIIPRHCAVD